MIRHYPKLDLLLHLFLLSSLVSVLAYDNGLGLTPPMGWNSWNRFHCEIEESLIQETAQSLVDLGLQDLGYQYINLDDCWQISRNGTGYVEEDMSKFPSGISAMGEYVHSLGLKFGLYSDAGIRTCQGRPGGLGFETQDAAMYAQWKIDYLKYDNCFNVGMNVKWRYHRMHEALNRTGQPIFFSLCEWGYKDPATWATSVGNSWRTTTDIHASWEQIMKLLDQNDKWHEYAGPGGWNDPDMLEVGNGHLTIAEQGSHFTLWCLIKAPLLLGNDLRDIPPEVLEIISNEEVIAWNQDPLGIQGYRRWSNSDKHQVWAGDLEGGDVAVVLLNRSDKDHEITAVWQDIGLSNNTRCSVRDVWKHQNLGTYKSEITLFLKSHHAAAIRLSPEYSPMPTVRETYYRR